MSKSVFCFTLSAMLFTLGLPVGAQEPTKLPRVGYLSAAASSSMVSRIDGFRRGLRELGYVEGKNIIIEFRYADGKLDRLPTFVAELLKLKVDVIVSAGPGATRSAKQATSTMPIVMAQDNDPVGNGFIATLARPGGNVTGLSTLGAPISGKQVELLKDIIPRLARVAVFGASTETATPQSLKEVELAAGALRVELHYVDILSPKDFETAFRTANKERADAVLALASAITSAHRTQIVELAVKSRLAAIYPHAEFVQAGGLMSYA